MVKATYLNVQVVFRLRMLADMFFPYPNLEIRMSPGALWSRSLATPKYIRCKRLHVERYLHVHPNICNIEKHR